jgi:ABC-type nitrate/sulfonate/bicarbonate transport system substrate-binding protein
VRISADFDGKWAAALIAPQTGTMVFICELNDFSRGQMKITRTRAKLTDRTGRRPRLVALHIIALLARFFVEIVVVQGVVEAAAPAARIRIGYSSISGSRISLWAAQEKGFFARQGVQAELVILSGIVGIQSLIAGEIQFYLGATDSAAQSAAKGSEIILLGTAEPLRYKLIVQPAIKAIHELKGKKIVVDRVGGTSYYISLRMLEKAGLKIDDVELMQVGGGGNQRVAAFKSGQVAGVISSTERFEQLKIPYNALADAGELGVKTTGNSYMTLRSFRDKNRDTVQRVMRALVEARGWLKAPQNRAATLDIFKRYMHIDDPWVLDLYYGFYVQPIPLVPYTQVDELREFVSYMPDGNQVLRNLKLAEFVDRSFLQNVEKEVR